MNIDEIVNILKERGVCESVIQSAFCPKPVPPRNGPRTMKQLKVYDPDLYNRLCLQWVVPAMNRLRACYAKFYLENGWEDLNYDELQHLADSQKDATFGVLAQNLLYAETRHGEELLEKRNKIEEGRQ